MFGTILGSTAGVATDAEQQAAMDVNKVCLDGFKLVYDAVWYRMDNKVFSYGDFDQYSYTV